MGHYVSRGGAVTVPFWTLLVMCIYDLGTINALFAPFDPARTYSQIFKVDDVMDAITAVNQNHAPADEDIPVATRRIG
jgi:hypothetical protein